MTETEILKAVGAVAGVGGIALGVLLIVFRDIIRKNIFPQLTKQHAYSLLRLIVVVVWTVALVGIAAWVTVSIMEQKGQVPKPDTPGTVVTGATGPSIFRSFDLKHNRVDLRIAGIIINNQSEVDDLIKQVEVVLAVPGLRQEDITSSYGKDLKLIDQYGKDWGSTFVLKKSEKVILECRVSFNYSDRSAEIFKKEGMRRLAITFKGSTNPTPKIDYCYREDLPQLGSSQNIIPMDCGKEFHSGG